MFPKIHKNIWIHIRKQKHIQFFGYKNKKLGKLLIKCIEYPNYQYNLKQIKNYQSHGYFNVGVWHFNLVTCNCFRQPNLLVTQD